jgi:hypothetical protein
MTASDATSRTDLAIEVGRALDELTAAVSAARALLSEGAACDLAGLDGRVEELCGTLTALAPEAGQSYLPALLRLSEELGGLQADCERQRTDALRMEHAAARGRAAHAYGAARPPLGRR